MSEVRSEKTKQEFIKYLEEHPEERFWQAVRNFSNIPFVVAYDGPSDMIPEDMQDTFYWEEKYS